MNNIKFINFSTEFIKLDSFLKLSCACSTGGEAKIMIQEGNVQVNGDVCYQRGRKIKDGDIIQYNNQTYKAQRKIKP